MSERTQPRLLPLRPFQSRSMAAAGLACVLVLALAPTRAAGEDGSIFEPPFGIPGSPKGVVNPKEGAERLSRIDQIRDVFQAIQACWRLPSGSGFSGQEITVRLSFKRNGELLGQPRITYYKAGAQPELREPFTRSVREAFESCTPLPFTESFGAAIAGRIFAFRFVDTRPM